MTSLPLAWPRDIQGKWDGPLPIIEDLAMWTIAEDIPTYIVGMYGQMYRSIGLILRIMGT